MVTVAVVFFLRGFVNYRRLGGEDHPRDRRGVEHRGPGDLDWVDDAVGYRIAVGQDSVSPRAAGSASTRSTGSVAQAGQCCWPLTVTRYRDATKPPRRSRLYPSTDSGTIAEMDARSGLGLNDPFEEAIDDALSSLPADLRAAMSNVEIVVEDEPPDGQPLLGLYRGVPLPRRSSTYSGVLPDKISIFGGPITRLAAGDADRLRREVRHVVLHEIAHHFGISDERLIELDRY
jgi:predicted Zn-dependent protease with MMP-like domain